MSKEVWLVLAGGAISVVTGIVGAVVTNYFKSREEARAETREKTRSERDRQHGVAEQILTLFSRFIEAIEATRLMTEDISPSPAEQRYDLYNQLKQKALYLPNDLAGHVRLLADVAYHADELAPGRLGTGHHWQSQPTILQNCKIELEMQLSAFLRGRPSPNLSPIAEQYELALEDDFDERRSDFAQEIAEADDAQEEWIRRDFKNRDRLRIANDE
ncbi:hypothetical protein SAMN05428985_104226 [Nocardioides sp. YR527]|uniref:hypothetical protein n=1 Tax=Nocardioides sp. YR527 TaxID=1881028 RepID=UPI00088C1260|nr:hypothetical protein [Nocardioides sp. YR527]SDK49177.1 hypothetical protein SAMN05428985_104226 [Nocardioides sp. YR527]